MRQLQKAHNAKRVMIEYNGMWQLQTLLDALPMDWPLAQIFLFFDAATFLNYNANMRSLVVDKLKLCDLVAFNRFTKEMDVMDFHKIVRAISRQVDIVYEYTDGSVIPDEIEDPLPFDLNAPVVEIGDRDYAIWYRDLWQDPKKYDGKTVRYKAIAVNGSKLSPGFFALGRQLMTCCVRTIRVRRAGGEERMRLSGEAARRTGWRSKRKSRFASTKRIESPARCSMCRRLNRRPRRNRKSLHIIKRRLPPRPCGGRFLSASQRSRKRAKVALAVFKSVSLSGFAFIVYSSSSSRRTASSFVSFSTSRTGAPRLRAS